jgi:chitodextrinase
VIAQLSQIAKRNPMNLSPALVLLPALCLSAQTVPAPYQATYTALSGQISSFDTAAKTGWNGAPSSFLGAPQANAASSDNYTTLLNPDYYSFNVTPELNSLQALGAKAITVHINFPILYQPYYTSIANPALYQEFVNFYKQFSLDVHARGLKLLVECTTAFAVPGTQFSQFQTYYKTLTWTEYMAGRAQNALTVAQLIQPDYMTVITEPDTEESDSGQTSLNTVSGGTQLLQTILTAIHGAGTTKVLIGAGAGTWIPNYTQWVQSFLLQPIDFLDMHVIQISNSDMTLAITAAQMAHTAGKPLGVSECWPMKGIAGVSASLNGSTDDELNPFSFWAPVDTAFLQAMVDFANANHLIYLAPSWTTYFSAYLDYGTYGSLPGATVMTDAYAAVGKAIQAGTFTSTGLAWEKAILPGPDTSAPATPAPPTAVTVAFTLAQIAWTPDTDNVGVAAYDLYRNGTLIATVNGLAFTDTGLTPGDTYHYTLKAFDAVGNVSAQSAQLTVETPNNAPPSVPSRVTVTASSKSAVSLTWSASTGGAVSYRVLRGTSAGNAAIHATVTTTSYTDSGVAPNTTYYYAIESQNASGFTSANSAVVSTTTPSH